MKELTYTKEKKDIKKILIIIMPIVFVILTISLIAFYCFIYNTPSSKLKRTLEDNNFKCHNKYCRKDIEEYQYEINYKTAEAIIKNNNMSFEIGLNSSNLYIIQNRLTCNFSSEYYTPIRSIDDTYKVDKKCAPYIEELNKIINKYESYLDEAKINIKEFIE